MTRTFTFILACTLAALSAFGQNYAQQFKDAKSDTIAQAKVLSAWERSAPKDPELFIAYFNYYVRRSARSEISLDATQGSAQSVALTDSSGGKPVAFLNESTKYQSDILQKGFDQINRGLALYPSRLDMRFGKIYMLGQAENYPEFAREIVAAIEYGHSISNAWLWKEGKPLEDAQQFFLSSLQDYITTIYNTEDNKLLPLMRLISETVVKYYPTHVVSLSNIALTYLVSGEYARALPYLLKAESIAPKDVIVLNNIAEAYKRSGDKVNAKAYYEKVIKWGSAEEAQDARQRMKAL